MRDVTKTDAGWEIETTDMEHDCLKQGGMSGRKVLYTRKTLAYAEIDYDADPDGVYNDHYRNADLLLARYDADEVLHEGHLIQ